MDLKCSQVKCAVENREGQKQERKKENKEERTTTKKKLQMRYRLKYCTDKL